MSKDAYYFSHDSNAKDDPKCVLMIEQLGMEGYGIYWVLIETLRDQADYTYPINLLPALARRYNTTSEKVKTVVFNYGLFDVKDDVIFFSQSLINRMLPLHQKREQARLAGLKSAEKRALKSNDCNDRSADVQQAFNDRSTSKVKKSKVNKRDNKAIFIAPALSEVENYFTEKGYTIEVARKAFEYYSTADWRDSTGKPVKNWKQKMLSVWFKDENKQTLQTQKSNEPYTINI